jgi:hypothetical protein
MTKAFLVSLGAAAFLASGSVEAKGYAWPCYWTHGRLTVGNGTPSVRIWPRGTRRLLGVVNPANPGSDVGELDTLPGNVLRLLGDHDFATIWGDFRICPIARDRDGVMRPVLLKAARGLVLTEAD